MVFCKGLILILNVSTGFNGFLLVNLNAAAPRLSIELGLKLHLKRASKALLFLNHFKSIHDLFFYEKGKRKEGRKILPSFLSNYNDLFC